MENKKQNIAYCTNDKWGLRMNQGELKSILRMSEDDQMWPYRIQQERAFQTGGCLVSALLADPS